MINCYGQQITMKAHVFLGCFVHEYGWPRMGYHWTVDLQGWGGVEDVPFHWNKTTISYQCINLDRLTHRTRLLCSLVRGFPFPLPICLVFVWTLAWLSLGPLAGSEGSSFSSKEDIAAPMSAIPLPTCSRIFLLKRRRCTPEYGDWVDRSPKLSISPLSNYANPLRALTVDQCFVLALLSLFFVHRWR